LEDADMGLSLLATLKLALEAAGFQTDRGGDFENARRVLRKRIEISAEFIRCVRDAMDRQVDRQVPCTTPPHDRSGNGS
jgi:hypothetical protein